MLCQHFCAHSEWDRGGLSLSNKKGHHYRHKNSDRFSQLIVNVHSFFYLLVYLYFDSILVTLLSLFYSYKHHFLKNFKVQSLLLQKLNSFSTFFKLKIRIFPAARKRGCRVFKIKTNKMVTPVA